MPLAQRGDAASAPLVLFVIGNLDVGGTETHIARLLPRLVRDGFRPIVYTLTHATASGAFIELGGIELLSPLLPAAARCLPRAVRRIILLPQAIAGLWWLMRRRRPDIVHLWLPEAYLVGGLCALAAGRCRRVMSRRSLNNYQQRHPILARLERRLHRHMSAVIGNSRAVVAQLLDEGVPPARLGLIYNGIEPRVFENLPPPTEIKVQLGIGQAPLVLTMIANLIPYKGHHDLLEALAGITDRLPPGWVLLCPGRDDGLGPALERQARALNLHERVRWMGPRTDVPSILHASDIGILASHEEGFSNSILEGMAAGLPMVVTDVGGNPEAVLHNVSGVVVPPRNPRALGEAILELACDPDRRQQLGRAARRRVAAVFSLAACVSRYERLYTALSAGTTTPVSSLLPADAAS